LKKPKKIKLEVEVVQNETRGTWFNIIFYGLFAVIFTFSIFESWFDKDYVWSVFYLFLSLLEIWLVYKNVKNRFFKKNK
jgi:uncharacterized membrane protein